MVLLARDEEVAAFVHLLTALEGDEEYDYEYDGI